MGLDTDSVSCEHWENVRTWKFKLWSQSKCDNRNLGSKCDNRNLGHDIRKSLVIQFTIDDDK